MYSWYTHTCVHTHQVPFIGRLTEHKILVVDATGPVHSLQSDRTPCHARRTRPHTPGAVSVLRTAPSRSGCSSELSPPVVALQLSRTSLSPEPVPWSRTVLSVMAALTIRNGLMAGSWMLITIGNFGALKPKSVDVCCFW